MIGAVTGASIVGGAGNDSFAINLDVATSANNVGTMGDTNTFFFGSGDGLDTLNFSNASTNAGGVVDLTLAVDSTLLEDGSTTGIVFTSTTSMITFNGGSGSIFVSGITGSAVNSVTALGFNVTTVSASAITDLG